MAQVELMEGVVEGRDPKEVAQELERQVEDDLTAPMLTYADVC